ncbi:MAG: hypothetical protein AAF567_10125 [Actinomycetota bacterium]
MSFCAEDERPHEGLVDEWVFATWTPDGRIGVVSGHRLFADRSWYWCALVATELPLMHLTEWDVAVRKVDPFIVKAPEMWAEHQLDAPMEQWTVGNEAYFVALDEPEEALGRAYGVPTPVAMDLEWYATEDPSPIADGYEQRGVVHGEIELLHLPNLAMAEAPAHRWRRWAPELAPLRLPVAERPGRRAPFAFPDGTCTGWVLTPSGWRTLPF